MTAELERRLRFRDRLRADPALADAYAALNRALGRAPPRGSREAYTEAKAPFIRRVLPYYESDAVPSA